MGQLRKRIRVIVGRVRAGEGAHVLADLGETAEHWLRGDAVPAPLRTPAERVGVAIGDFARARRPAPSDVPPPAAPPRTNGRKSAPARAREKSAKSPAARPREKASTREDGARAKASRSAKPKAAEPPKARASARRAPAKKRRPQPSPPPEPPATPKTNGKGRTKRASARRGRDEKSQKPT